jgi:hypothetical protein
MFKGAYPVMGLGLWQGRGIIGESSAFNKPSGLRLECVNRAPVWPEAGKQPV